jgi:hypothetical protein
VGREGKEELIVEGGERKIKEVNNFYCYFEDGLRLILLGFDAVRKDFIAFCFKS